MANAYSIQRNRQGWIDPTDQDFTLKAMMFKQQKYTANQAKTDAVIEQYKSLQLAKGVDQEYLNERIQGLLNNVNESGAQDYGSDAVTRSIKYHIDQALDGNVMTAMQETAKIRAYQAEVAKIKEKTPEAYNSLNESFGIAPAQDYLNDGQVGSKIKGSLTYTPYKDVEGEIQKTLLDIQTKAKDGSYEYEVMPGKLQKVTVNGKSASELREIALGLMGDKYNQQFTINSWGKHGGFKNIEGTTEQMNSYYDNLVNAHNQDIEEYKAQISGGKLSEDAIAQKNASIKALENQKLLIQNNKINFQKDPISGLVAMEKEGVANRLGKSLGLLQTKSMEYKADDYYFKSKNLELDYAQYEHNVMKDTADLNFKYTQLASEERRAADRIAAGLIGKDGDGDGDGTSSSSSGGGSGGSINWVPGNGLNEIPEGVDSNNQQVLSDIRKVDNEYMQTSRAVMQNIIDIATGKITNVDSATKNEAIQLVNNFKSKHGDVGVNAQNVKGEKVNEFINIYSRADAYQNLAFLSIGGEKTATGESMSKLSYKTRLTDMKNQIVHKKDLYAKARKAAQEDEVRSGNKGSYLENKIFKEYLSNSVSKIGNSQQFTGTMGKKDVGTLNALLLDSGKTDMGEAAENGAISFQVSGDKVSISYQTKGKGEDKEGIMSTVVIPDIPLEKFKAHFKGVEKTINLNSKKGIYTAQNYGTKELVSSPIAFLDPNSVNFNAFSKETESFIQEKGDLRFLTEASTKTEMNTLVNSLVTPEMKGVGKQLVNEIFNPLVINTLKVVVQHTASYDGSGKSDLLVSLVNPRTGKRIITQNLGHKENADDIVKLNQYQPQILYSKLVGGELRDTVIKSNTAKEFSASEGLINLLKYTRGDR